MYDLKITNARIIDGTGSPWRRGDVAVYDGRIVAVGAAEGEAKTVVDAADHYLCPGFIDIHCHSDDTIFEHPTAESRVLQGVTTELAGNCGASAAPRVPGDTTGFQTMKQFFDAVDALPSATNIAMLAGLGTIRAAAMGYKDEPATAEQIARMQQLVADAMEDGAYGVSTGLIYTPGSYASTEELIEVTKAVKPYGGFYATHMRNEKSRVVEAVREAIAIAGGADVPLEISHHKVTCRPDWKVTAKMTTALIEQARERGLDVTCDQYPYCATATNLSINIPSWGFDGGVPKLMERLCDPETRKKLRDECNEGHLGRWETIFVSYVGSQKNAWMAGKSIPYIAEKLGGKDPAETLFDIVFEENDDAGEVCFGMCEEDVSFIMQKPYTMIGSDGWAFTLSAPGKPHPRSYGAFVRVLSHYCLKEKLFSLEEAVRKMTAAPAGKIGLADRGTIKAGQWADLVLFDANTLLDTPTYENPQQAPNGILQVYVNGSLTVENGRHTGTRAGRALRRGRQ